MKLFSLAISSLLLFSCTSEKTTDPTKTTEAPLPSPVSKPLPIPHHDMFPDISTAWLNLLKEKDFVFPKAGHTIGTPQKTLKLLPPKELFKTPGQLIRVQLIPPPSSKKASAIAERIPEKLSWAHILHKLADDMKEVQPQGEWPLSVQESSLSAAKKAWSKNPINTANFYYKIVSSSKNSKLGNILCQEVAKWAAASQLLAGKFNPAQSRKKVTLALSCQVSVFSSPLPPEPFLELGSLAFPFLRINSSEVLFKKISDLDNPETLRLISPESFTSEL